uniref:ribosomal protein S12 n=1 Tax=Euplotes cristatus TaxID=756077 RepID=UPI002E78CADC|nr:ribosomal protein S12 [Euplotes cristatus]UPM52068.1 ribosomal protein S12 [Euplotes cristatus]
MRRLPKKFIRLNQLKVKNYFYLRNLLKSYYRHRSRVFNRLYGAPQRKGVILRVVLMTPKKPNSAIRHVAKVSIYKTGRRGLCRIPGVGSLPTKFNRVLFRGGRANDLPTVRLTLIRGVFDFSGLYTKKRRRSLYGAPRPESSITHRRRRYRHLGF